MNNRPDDHLETLFALVRRGEPVVGRLEYGFATRVLARLREERAGSLGACAWRLCPFFAALTLALFLWNHTSDAAAPHGLPLLAETATPGDEQSLARLLTGDVPP